MRRRAGWRLAGVVAGSLLLATAAVAALELGLGAENASSVYLVAVVACALVGGTGAAVVAAIGSFLVYNFVFTDPRFTFVIDDPGVLVSVVVLLFVGIVVGQLAARERVRTETARAREREARAMFGVSRVLATRTDTESALAQIVRAVRDETAMERVWVALGPAEGEERTVADSDPGSPLPAANRVRVLQRRPGDEPAVWALIHRPGPATQAPAAADIYRVRIEASEEPIGSVWSARARGAGEPDHVQTRLLAAVADQVGQALARDRAAEASRAAEVARQSDALKTSLLQAVSHDFRTPLAVIRAAAGSMDEEARATPEDRRADRLAIEREVEYLNRLVANLLDMSRIEAGALRADRDVYELDELVERAVARVRSRAGGRTLEVRVEPALVRVDPVFLDAILSNVLDNALKYTGDAGLIRVTAEPRHGAVRLRVEDDGPGVPDDALERIFEKFWRVPGARGGSRGGLGVGLAVVRGLSEAMGGRATAERSTLGGLAIVLELPSAEHPAASVPAGEEPDAL